MLNSSIGKNKSVISENKFVAEIIDLFSELKIPPADGQWGGVGEVGWGGWDQWGEWVGVIGWWVCCVDS